MKMNDPTGLIKVGRPGKVLMVENHLSCLRDEDMENATPYSIHSPFSVFKLKHLENGKCVTVNIPPKKLADIEQKTEIANAMIMAERMAPKKSSTEYPCYNLKFLFGSFKGKTPAEVLLANPQDKSKLLQEKENLGKNLAKYKDNQKLMDAIDEAIKLFDAGELKKDAVTSAAEKFFIYNEDCKIPNVRKLVEKNGKMVTFVYSVTIECNPKMDNPIVVTMMNCYAPPVNGKNEVLLAEAVETERSKFVLTEGEWNSMVKAMSSTEEIFKMFNYKAVDEKVNTYLKSVIQQSK